MPQMGKPINLRERSYQNVQMAQGRNQQIDPNDIRNNNRKISDREKERLMHKITGYKKKDDLIVDANKHNKMGKDEFLRLLTTQLQNQDPTSPMKQEKMAAELAQFSQLEQLTNLNAKFESMGKNQQVQDKFYGASFLGKEVVTSGSSLKFEGEGTDADILFSLPRPASKVLVRVFDARNNMVGEMWRENIGRGNQTVSWDGLQLDNTITAPGEFRTQVFAWDQFADPVDVKTKSTGLVESVFFENGETVLKVDGKKVFLRDVDSFHTPGTTKKIKPKAPQPIVNSGRSMGSPLNNTSAKSIPTNLPLAQNTQANVNLNKVNNHKAVNDYAKNIPTTGITSVYDE
ncbi:MAG: hypothetical protein HON90_13920 [Halobacteriovoraceae bacterium]|jgi:flagellar basal-body rod modification protein FlgD|nr:hypothetical protein [Halobacteriovoraceae bacterium]